ncbi:UNVERIFIED_CONTAM: B3 domain-containing protein [Sesamum calycinum]|uniref:B3 domain-containing protein n=1 Tax=Sesamum calycinum TaxID=2727403 RepID=A0AAW2PAB1_9LAMI
MVMSKGKYEALRQQRLEENKKRMEELHLPILSQALKNASSPKSSPMKKTKPRIARTELVPVRRSERFSNKSAPQYKEGLSSDFCKRKLPRNDGVMSLVDEQGEEWPVIYLARKTGLSGGWKKFSVDHDLADGDALVFQLIRPTVFKVFIIRVDDSGKTANEKTYNIEGAEL